VTGRSELLSTERQRSAVARRIRWSAPSRRKRTIARLSLLLSWYGRQPQTSDRLRSLLTDLELLIPRDNIQDVWFAIAVLSAQLPLEDQVIDAHRRAAAGGLLAALHDHLGSGRLLRRLIPVIFHRTIEIVDEQIVVDVGHTSEVEFATGIQRVVREIIGRWETRPEVIFAGWTLDRTALRRLERSEQDQALTGNVVKPTGSQFVKLRALVTARRQQTVLIPRRGNYLLPELSLERESLFRIAAFAQFSGAETGAVGFDAVPISSSETVNYLVSGGFAAYLATIKHFDRIVVISEAAAVEYRGWRDMLVGTGIKGPEISVISLPSSVSVPSDSEHALESARAEFITAGVPLVLCVGSHEPRKNHLAVLHSAEILWREGLQFSLVFVGGNSWSSGVFNLRVAELQRAGRPIRAEKSVTDEQLWALYRLARFTVFPSFNEGYGLPVAESLTAGTPVLTSNFGATLSTIAGGGGLGVDPRNQGDITNGIRRLLTDDRFLGELAAEARKTPAHTTWEDYAEQVWGYLLDGGGSH
jgi:glycosyltransferase involved in cell wall biosynthesis